MSSELLQSPWAVGLSQASAGHRCRNSPGLQKTNLTDRSLKEGTRRANTVGERGRKEAAPHRRADTSRCVKVWPGRSGTANGSPITKHCDEVHGRGR